MRNPTALLSEYARQTRHAPLPPEVREKAVLCLLDALGVATEARQHSTVAAASALVTEVAAGQSGASIWATGIRVPVGEACLVNGIAAHAHFQDDTDMDAWAHPGSLIVPVALGLAELRSQPVEVAVRGVIAGYAALNWLGASGRVGRALVDRGFRASPTLGSIATAVTAVTVLDLDQTAATSAIGLAADVTGGVLEPVRAGAQDWRWQNGTAAWRGALAGLLAEAGMQGPEDPLTGPHGFLTAFCGITPPPDWSTPPESAAIERVWFKRYPILGDNMAPAVAAADLHHQIGGPDLISGVDVHINEHFAAYPGTSYAGPFHTTEQAVASTAYAVAALLAYGDIRYSDYVNRRDDPLIDKLVRAVRVFPEPDYGYLDSTVVVHTEQQSYTRRSAECPREVFFRDRAAAREAFSRNLTTAGAPVSGDLPDLLFSWLDGGRAPTFAELFADHEYEEDHV
jgi:2-methylcitrate dehydratase PrpD